MNFSPYPSYSEALVEHGDTFPSHWDRKSLKWIVHETNAGEVIDKSYWGGTTELLYTCALEPLPCDFPDFPSYKRTTRNDLLLTRNGTPYVHKPVENSIYTNVVQRITLKSSVNRDYIALALANSALSLKGYGVSIESLNYEMWKELLIPIPSLEEQISIFKFLEYETTKLDALIVEQEKLIQLLKEKRQAVISHVVTKGLDSEVRMKDSGNLWLGAYPEHWKFGKLKHIKSKVANSFVDGPFGSNLKSEHFIQNGSIFVIESSFATQGVLDEAELKTISLDHFKTIERSEVRAGDIVIAKIGAQYGKSSVLPQLSKRAVVSGNSLKLTVNLEECDTNFVNLFLTNLKSVGAIEDIVNATAQPALSLGEMNNLPILIPPLLEQQLITKHLNDELGKFDSLIQEANVVISLLTERRSALISAAVTGKIDVRNAFKELEAT